MVVGTLIACALVIGVGGQSYAAAAGLGLRAGSPRLSAATVFGLASFAATFLVLAFAGWLNAQALAAIAVVSVGACVYARARLRRWWVEDQSALGVWWEEVRVARLQWPLLAVVAVAGLRFLRALASPPQATDALTYHLFRAGQWAQAGALVHEPAPDAWGYYDYYPLVGDGLWALAMAPTQSDTWLGLAYAMVFAGLALGAYAAARSLEVDRASSTLVSMTICSVPAVLVFSATGYLDGLVLAAFLLGLAMLMGPDPRGPGVAVLAFCLAAAFKVTGLPLLILGVVAAGVRALRRHRGGFKALVGFGLVGLVIASPPYLRGWLEWQNPLYPFGLSLGGREIWTGNLENTLLQTGALAPVELTRFDPVAFVRALFVPRRDLGIQHLNLGPIAPAFAILAGWGLLRAWRSGKQRTAVVLLLALVAVFTWRLAGDSMLAHRTFAAPAVGRNLAVPTASVILLASLGPRSVFVGSSWVAIAVGLWLSVPRGLSRDEVVHSCFVLALLLGVVAIAHAIARLRSPRSNLVELAVVSLGLSLVSPLLEHVRATLRYRVYGDAVEAVAFDPHPTDPRAAKAWPLWQHLDEQSGLRIAYTAGWDGRGHNWYRAPVLGRRLQNQVCYVPPTRDGDVVDYREHERLVRSVDLGAWVTRLREREIDYLFVAAPNSVEAVWAAGVPDVFELEREAGPHRLYRVSRSAIDARRAGQPQVGSP